MLELKNQMTRGRKPKPAQLKVVEGNPGKRPMPKKKRYVPDGFRVPSDLSPEAKKYWKQIVKTAPLGLLRACDAQALKRYVVALCIYDKAKSDLENSHSIIRSKNGSPIHNPNLGILNRQTEILLRIEAEFGFTPSARARLGFQDHDVIFDDEYDDAFHSKPTPAHLKDGHPRAGG